MNISDEAVEACASTDVEPGTLRCVACGYRAAGVPAAELATALRNA